MKLNYITNVDRNVQCKMRFFSDYFSFVNEFLGKLPYIPFDNQLSLVDKTVFQIENNFEHCFVYVTSYLSQLIALHNDSFEPPNILFDEIKNHFKSFLAIDDKKEWLNTNKEFLEKLKLLKSEFETNLFDNNFKALLSFLKCPHPLKKHKKEIEYRTRIIVSLFRLKGHSKKSLDTYISRIISDDEYKFPFPPHIIAIKSKEEYKASTKQFLLNRDFDKQFEGLKNLFIAEHLKSGYFFFVIENCIFDDKIIKDFKVSFEKVTFISPVHTDLRKLRKNIKEHDKENTMKNYSIFFGKHKMLAYVHLGYENRDAKKDDGLRIVSEELLSLNQYFEGNLAVNNLHYLFYEAFETELWSSKRNFSKVKKTHISHFDFEEFKDNPYEALRNNSSSAKALILQSEKVFLKAFARDEIEYYWIFIENTFAPLLSNNDKIRKSFVKILLKLVEDLKADFLVQVGGLLSPYIFNSKEEGLDESDMHFIHTEIFTKKNFNFNICQFKEKVKNVFLKDMFSHHKIFNSSKNIEMWKAHFSTLLLDLYAYRNSLVHSGQINEYSRIKLGDVLPKLMSRARWLIIKACRKNENLNYSDLINKLTK